MIALSQSWLAFVGFQGRGCADGVQPDFCHALLLEALLFPHSIGFSGGQLSSYIEGSSALDFPLIHDAHSQEQS